MSNGRDKLGGTTYNISFGVVITVGTPTSELRTPIEHIHYNFNSDWDDKLVSYGEIDYINGVPQTEATLQSYTYDSQGNPTYITNFNYNGTTYYAASLSWDGRELKSMTILSGLSSPTYLIVFNYNDQGYRTKKILYTFSGYQPYITETIHYPLLNEKAIYETNGTYGILFTYDYDEILISFNYDSNVNDSTVGIEYYYIRNLVGDITHIINSSGTELVHYIYDAYGNITIDGSSANMALAKINPCRYHEYRYDNELSWYYLNSRYYNPQVGRFVNADGLLGQVGDILSTNMFAYCANNPVMYLDPSGEAWWHWAAAVGVVAILATLTIISCGGFAVASYAILFATNGVAFAGVSSLATILACATSGLALALAGMAIYAAFSSNTWDEFADEGELALYSTGIGGVLGAINGYFAYNTQIMNTSGTRSTQETGKPGSTYTQYDSKGNIVRFTQYGNDGNQEYRIDYQGKPHYCEGFGPVIPHIHVYEYTVNNGYLKCVVRTYPW